MAAIAPEAPWHPCTRDELIRLLGADSFAAAARSLTSPPSTTCIRVNTLHAQPQEVAAALCRALDCDTDVCSAHPALPEALLIRSSGVCSIDVTPACGREVAVNRRCAEAVLRGAEVFVPGVVAISAGVEENQLVAVTAVIEPLQTTTITFTRGTRLPAGDVTSGGRMLLGIGRTVLPPRAIFRAVDGIAVTMVCRRYEQRVTGEMLRSILPPGSCMLQNLPSIVAAHALAPSPGSHVLDMCASPGGKTSVLAALMGNEGSIVALDVNFKKVDAIRALCTEMGCNIVQAACMDATKAVLLPQPAGVGPAEQEEPHDHGRAAGAAKIEYRRQRKLAGAVLRRTRVRGERNSELDESGEAIPALPKMAPFAPESFDYILCDAPCTALGLKPRLSQPVTAKELHMTASYQRALLHTAVALLRPGGALVFSTCTISPLENESNVGWLLSAYPCMKLVPHTPRVAGPGLAGPDSGNGPAWLTPEQAAMVQRFRPETDDTIGFFIARFEKTIT